MTEQNNRPLPLRRACEMIGMVDDNGKVTFYEIRKLRRKLLGVERTTGKRCIFGGGEQGLPNWTTPRVLAELRLLPEDPHLYADFREAVDGIHDRLDVLTEKLDAVARTAVENSEKIHKHERGVGR